jgi:phosphoglycerol transferase MdoB-like AlkP superfamily enzyme
MPVSWKKLSIIGPALVVVPLCSVLGMEFIQRGSLIGSIDWMIQHPMIFVLNALLVFCVLALMYSVLGSLVVSIGVTAALLSIMSLISYFKVKLIGEPFFPWDILLNKESFKIVPLVAQADALLRIGGLIGIVALIFFLRLFIPRLSLPLTGRAALLIVSLIGLYSFGLRTPLAANLMSQAKVGEIIWNQKQNYEANGLALGFTMNIKNSIVPKPPSYSEPTMAALADHISSSSAVSSSGLDSLQGKAPNVIFIMNEAFWDPTLLPNVSFSEDPAPTVHRLQKESSSGYILSPNLVEGQVMWSLKC